MHGNSNNSLFRLIAVVLALAGTVFAVLNVIDIEDSSRSMLLPESTNVSEPNTRSGSSAIVRVENTVTPNSQTSDNSDTSGSSIQRLPTATAIPTTRPTRTPQIIYLQGTVNTPRLNVRSGPSADDFITFRVSQGDSVRIVARNAANTWVQVDVGVIGWVNADYLRIGGSTNNLPVRDRYDPVPASTVRMVFDCPGARGPSFSIGDRFTVPYGDGPTSAWSRPNAQPRTARIAEGRGGTILGGPICTGAQDGYLIFWYVRTDAGEEGYVSEGYSSSRIPWISRS